MLADDKLPWTRLFEAKASFQLEAALPHCARHINGSSAGLQISVGADRYAGRIVVHSINRIQLRHSKESFHWHLNEFSEYAYDMGTTLFDGHGRLRRHLHGAFDDAADQGRVLYIPEITLKPAYHHQGIGCKAVKMFLQELKVVFASDTWCVLAGKLILPHHNTTPQHTIDLPTSTLFVPSSAGPA